MSGRHLVGFARQAPADAAARLRSALGVLGLDKVSLHESPWLTVAYGPADACSSVEDDVMFVLVAGVLFPDEQLDSSLSRSDEDAPRHLRFEGALLASDRHRRAVTVSRDQLGYGSLYWTETGGAVAFATELRLLLAVLDRRPIPDSTAIALWLGLDASRTDLSFYEGVHQLPPGHRLVVTPEETSVEAYWQPTYAPPEQWTAEEAVEELKASVLRAIERRLPSTGRTGVLMSGGLDSSAVAGFTHSLRPDLTVYSDVFPTLPEVDESPWIDAVVRSLQVESVQSAVEPRGVLADLAGFIGAWGVPPESANYWGQPLLLRAAQDGIATLLTGEGGDEIFAVRDGVIADRLRRGHVLSALSLTRSLPQMLLYPSPRRLATGFWHWGMRGAFPRLVRSGASSPGWLAPAVQRELREAADPAPWRQFDAPHWWAAVAYSFTTLIPAVGVPVLQRRLGEAAGLRMCSPLLDLDLLETSLRCAPELGFNGILSKPLLRAAAEGVLPDEVRLRRGKTRFVRMVVDGVGGADFDVIAHLLDDPAAEVNAYVDRKALRHDLLENRPPGYGDDAADWSFHLYRVVALECWLREEREPGFVDRLSERQTLARPAFRIRRLRPEPAVA